MEWHMWHILIQLAFLATMPMRLSTSLRPSVPHKGQQCHRHATTSRPGRIAHGVETKCNSCPLKDPFVASSLFIFLALRDIIIINPLKNIIQMPAAIQNLRLPKFPQNFASDFNSTDGRLLYTKHRLTTSACTQAQDQPEMGNIAESIGLLT